MNFEKDSIDGIEKKTIDMVQVYKQNDQQDSQEKCWNEYPEISKSKHEKK